MGEGSPIEWTDDTYNPWWGCVKVSSACTHCYAETTAARWGFEWGAGSAPREFGDKHWNEPLAWNRKAVADGVRRRVFCASMADVFEARDNEHGATLDRLRERLWLLIESTPGLDWQLLTKRPQNIRAMVPARWLSAWPSHVWVGCTVENQAAADERIPHLLSAPARVRFLSCEPLLSAISLQPWMQVIDHCVDCGAEFPSQGSDFCPECGSDHAIIRTETAGEAERFRSGERYAGTVAGKADIAGRPIDAIHWVISGGESGPKARPTHPDWLRSLRDQCAEAGVPYMLKQIGEWAPHDGPVSASVPSWRRWWATTNGRIIANPDGAEGHWMMRIGKHKSGRTLDGITHDGFPEVDDG